jgi:hypothetical protein
MKNAFLAAHPHYKRSRLGSYGSIAEWTRVPKGLDESSPAPHCWVKFLRRDPSRQGRLMAARRVKFRALLSSLAGRTCLLFHPPAVNCWATIIESLQDEPSLKSYRSVSTPRRAGSGLIGANPLSHFPLSPRQPDRRSSWPLRTPCNILP